MSTLKMIGLGIADERSVSLEGLDSIREADAVFCEFFTSILREGSVDRLEELSERRIEIIDRAALEEKEVIMEALRDNEKVCFLTAGDPLTATTHQEIRLDALRAGHDVRIIHSSSVFNAAGGAAGLQHYKFGRTTTLAFPEQGFFPTSPLDVIIENMERGLHTLVLLDIQAHNQRYMTSSEGCDILLKMEEKASTGRIGPETMVAAIMRAGRDDGRVVYASISEIAGMGLEGPPHCLIVPGKLHFMEEEVLQLFRIE